MKPFLSIETVASVCHEANKQFCDSQGEEDLHKHWKDLNENEKKVSIQALRGLFQYQDEILASPVRLFAERAWLEWKKAVQSQGWVYGPTKDVVKKTHTCIVDQYDKLPLYEKVKDEIYIALFKTFLQNYEILQ